MGKGEKWKRERGKGEEKLEMHEMKSAKFSCRVVHAKAVKS